MRGGRACNVMSYQICYLDAAWQQHVVGAGVGMDKPKFECLECNPPRTFRSVSGYNGHMQFKHDKTGVFSGRPPSKQTEMIQQLLDQQEHLLNQQDKLVNQQQALYALIAERSDNRIGVFSGGNGNDNPGNDNPGNDNPGNDNGNPGNNNQGDNNQGDNNQGNGSGNVDQGEGVQEYHCQGCGSPVLHGKKKCPVCNRNMNWAAVSR